MGRLSLLMDDHVHRRLNEVVPHGFRRHLMIALIEMVLEAIEREGPEMTAALITKEFVLVPTRSKEVSQNGTK